MPELEGKIALITGMFPSSRVLSFYRAEVLTLRVSLENPLIFPLKCF